VQILLVDDHAVVRRGVRHILSQAFPQAVFGEASDSMQALGLINSQGWDLVFLDLSIPGPGGIEILHYLQAHHPKTPAIVFTMHPEEQCALMCLDAGARSYLMKDATPETIISATKRVLAGGRYVTPIMAELLADRPLARKEHLSDREFEVLQMIGIGKSPSEIAAGLSLSIKTVNTYRSRLMRKMHFRSNAQLLRHAIRHQLLTERPACVHCDEYPALVGINLTGIQHGFPTHESVAARQTEKKH
jgi:two-component system, NarL family, invasion response regulator UvrY